MATSVNDVHTPESILLILGGNCNHIQEIPNRYHSAGFIYWLKVKCDYLSTMNAIHQLEVELHSLF